MANVFAQQQAGQLSTCTFLSIWAYAFTYTLVHCHVSVLPAQGKYEQAEPLYERSQAIQEKALGPDHPDVAQVLSNRAALLVKQVRAMGDMQ